MRELHIHTCMQNYVATIHNHILSLQIIDANESTPKESDRATSENLEEKTKVNRLQRQLKDLEDQNRNLAGKLKNVCM